MRLKVFIHHEGPEYWTEVAELPGCFAAGRTLSELHEALTEAIGFCLGDEAVQLEPNELHVGPLELSVLPLSPPP